MSGKTYMKARATPVDDGVKSSTYIYWKMLQMGYIIKNT